MHQGHGGLVRECWKVPELNKAQSSDGWAEGGAPEPLLWSVNLSRAISGLLPNLNTRPTNSEFLSTETSITKLIITQTPVTQVITTGTPVTMFANIIKFFLILAAAAIAVAAVPPSPGFNSSLAIATPPKEGGGFVPYCCKSCF